MSVMRYEPWSLMNQLQNELSRNFDKRLGKYSTDDNGDVATSDWAPAVDIKEEDQRFVIRADIPGVEPHGIEVNMDNGMLTIKGERDTQTEQDRDGYKRIERVHGSFYRRFSLPDTADADKISAKSSNGVLEVVIPKHEKLQPRRIEVQA